MSDRSPTYDSIALRAFRLFEIRGRGHGYDLADWLRAEAESNIAGAKRKQTDEELRTSEAQYRNLFQTMAQGVIYYDSEARIISANPAAERILGVRLDELQGRTALDPSFNATHEDGSNLSTETHPAVGSLRTGKNTDGITMRIFNPKEGQYRWILMAGVPQFKPGETIDLADAREKIETWRCDYNQVRPHSALGYLTPAEFAQRSAASSGCARMAPPFEAAPSGGERVVTGVALENQKPEKVSLSLD